MSSRNLSRDSSDSFRLWESSTHGGKIVADFQANWKGGGREPAVDFLARQRVESSAKSTILDVAYEEFCFRAELGEPVNAADFAAQFPDVQASLVRLLAVHGFMAANSEMAESFRAEAWPECGDSVAGFQLREELGRGAFGRVFLAEEEALGDRLVVVKLSRHIGAEAQIISKLPHPNIVPVYSVAETESGLNVICMPYLGRATLLDLVDNVRAGAIPSRIDDFRHIWEQPAAGGSRRSFDARENATRIVGDYSTAALEIGLRLAEALAFAHERGVCHQDLKPSNVLLTFSGDVLLLDFNLSFAGRAKERIGGTLPYMAPEQIAEMLPGAAGSHSYEGARCDIFALGVLLCELFTGEMLFSTKPQPGAAGLETLIESRRQVRIPKSIRERLNRRTLKCLSACLAFEPADRPTIGEVIDSLRKAKGLPARAQRWTKVNPRKFSAGVLGAGLLVVAGIGASGLRPPPAERLFRDAEGDYRGGNFSEAIELLNRSIIADKSSADAYILRGKSYQRAENYVAASADYMAAYRLKKSPELLALAAFCVASQRRWRDAESLCRLATSEGGACAANSNNEGYCYLRIGDPTKAKALFDQAIATNDRLQAPWINRSQIGLTKRLGGEKISLDESIRDARRAIEIGPPSLELHVQLAALIAMAFKAGDARRSGAIDQLRLAIAGGWDAKLLTQDPIINSLQNEPGFNDLRTVTRNSELPKFAKKLVDTLDAHIKER